ncbi:MAG: anthrax toxin-like adenylyl cyclase domain-containing protein, partial [Rubrivivax sp.]|nr:anthrax toxin-like adenylyl cyclase domain-containing protein [Rubrivivax sp.]
MTQADMEACVRVAKRLDEVIIFRSTGPWAKRWIERGYPTKNFHVKGKSSDWGPQAGFVPYDGSYSKVGYNAAKAAEGTKQNDKGLVSQFAGRFQLQLSAAEITMQLTEPAGEPPRNAIVSSTP